MARQTVCTACETPVIVARDPAGRRVALDQGRDATSLYAVMKDTDLKLRVRVLAPGEQPGRAEHRHQRHDDTCTARRREAGSD